jgi:acetyl esterase/lipase
MSENTYPLWETVPASLGSRAADKPTITVVKPASDVQRNAAVVVYPGGGYQALMDYEGIAYADWLAQHGYTGLVVKYRLVPDGYTLPVIFGDAVRAIRWARRHAGEFGYDPLRIGAIGSSAGGHLVANLVTHFDAGQPDAADPVDRVSSRPDAGILCYPAVHLPHSRRPMTFLFGEADSPELWRYYAADINVRTDTPPCFIFHTVADQMVPVNESIRFALALQKHKIPYEMHLYQKGSHGVALGNGHPWTVECLRWLKELWE